MREVRLLPPLLSYKRSPLLLSTDSSEEDYDSAGDDHPAPDTLWMNATNRNIGVLYTERKWELGKHLFVIVYLFLASIANYAVIAYVHDISGREPLPDIVFRFVPEISIAATIGDILIKLCLVSLFSMIFFHRDRLIILRRLLFIGATVFSMRAVTLMVTQLPPGYSDNARRCRGRLVNLSLDQFLTRLGSLAIRFGMQEDEEGMLCGDMLFSGHTIVMMVCLLFVAHYLPTKFKFLQMLPYCFAYIGMACLIISRTHYTVDVVVSHWLTTFVFITYHAHVEMDPANRATSIYDDYAYFRVVAWLEENVVPGRLDDASANPIAQLMALNISGKGDARSVHNGKLRKFITGNSLLARCIRVVISE